MCMSNLNNGQNDYEGIHFSHCSTNWAFLFFGSFKIKRIFTYSLISFTNFSTCSIMYLLIFCPFFAEAAVGSPLTPLGK
jgi:hypothetical protein